MGCKPVAVIEVDTESGDAPLAVNFDASKSTDKGKDIREYSWDFDNDGKIDESGVRVEHTFNIPGEYTVKLVVRDAKDKTSQAVKTITVKEVILRANITADTSACILTPVNFDASASIDKDNDIISYEWDFDNDGVMDASGVNAFHGFSEEKTYNVRLTVHDAKGNTSQAFHDIRIYGSPTLEISADEESIVYPFVTTLRWHAKNITNLSITDNNTGRRVYEGTASDDFENVNPYRTTTYTVTATGPCGEVSKDITIYVYPSHSHAVITASVNSGCFPFSVDFDASSSTDINNDISGYEWDFDGDGTYDASGINSTHTFSARGEYHAGLRITDPLNHTSETTLIIRAYGQPSADIKSDSLLIGTDGKVTLTWTTTDATSVSLDNNPVSLNGTVTIPQTGTKTYTLTAAGLCGTATDTITVMPDMPISVTIETPHPLESINSPEVLVKGTVNNPLGGETMIVVNGTPAFLYENQYIASGVSLTQGSNIITVEAIGEYGNKGQASLTVNSTSSEKLISISGSDITGVSPMETTLSIKVPQGYIPVLSGLHPQNGSINVLEQTPDYQYRIRLTGHGIYTFIARTTDRNNNEYSDSISIIVQDKQKIDNNLKSMWTEMKTKLVDGNIDESLEYFIDPSKERFKEIFTVLKDKLPEIIGNMADLKLVYIEGPVAKYRILRNQQIDGQMQTIAYYVYFTLDPFGAWHIDSF
jgi:PKD repeat protein